MPPLSMWFASVTSLDHTSNCHLTRPSTPQCTRPVWMPTRMFTFTAITSRTSLPKRERENVRERERKCHITKATQYKATTCIVQLCVGCAALCVCVGCVWIQSSVCWGCCAMLCPVSTHAMASIISSPISTAQCA